MKYFICLFATVMIIFSCKKSCDNSNCADGYIYWGGDPAADGLGWYFAERRTGSWKPKQVKSNELPNEFKNLNDSASARACLEETAERAPCFCLQPSYYYKIKSIKKR